MNASERTELIELVENAIWTDLESQFERWDGPCVVRSEGLIDGHVEMGAVATEVVNAVLDRLGMSE
jgi:hypothetical protein